MKYVALIVDIIWWTYLMARKEAQPRFPFALRIVRDRLGYSTNAVPLAEQEVLQAVPCTQLEFYYPEVRVSFILVVCKIVMGGRSRGDSDFTRWGYMGRPSPSVCACVCVDYLEIRR